MSAEGPKPPTTPRVKTLNLVVEVPINLDVAGSVVLVFDKTLSKPHLVAPVDDPALCLILLQVLTNTLSGVAINHLMNQKKGLAPGGSGLWIPNA